MQQHLGSERHHERVVRVQVYLTSKREQELFRRVKEALGEDDTGTFTYLLKNYAEKMNLISEALHPTSR